MKPADVLDLVIEEDSVVRVHIHTYNPKNQIRAFIYNFDEKVKKPLGYSVGGRSSSTLFMHLKREEKAYRLIFEYESLDQQDPCPIAHVRIVSKPIYDTIRENLVCRGKPLPPSTVSIKTDDVVIAGEFAFPGDWLEKVVKDPEAGMEYDIVIEWPYADPNATYYMDVETRSDFLASQLQFSLLYEHHDKTLRPLGHSEQIGTAMDGGELVQRLKLLDREGDLADDIDLQGAILRLRLPYQAFEAIKFAKSSGMIASDAELCHTFEMSIRAENRNGQNEAGQQMSGPSRLMRVRWEGHETNHNLFDPRVRIFASLEFDRSMKQAFQMLKTADWVALQPIHTGDAGSTNTQPDVIKPLSKHIHSDDPSTIVLEFQAGVLARGWCHQLSMISIGGPFGHLDFDDKILSNDLTLCTTNCLCDQVGTSSCDEQQGKCICKHTHSGDTCNRCATGYTHDPQTKECHPSSRCKANGGKVDCNGHGSCRQQGGTAICTCAPGFKNDGLDQCAKCIDPMFDYPKCQVRSFIIEDPAITCHGLSHIFPASIYEGGPDHRKDDPTQGADGVIDWAQRFRLIEDNQETKYSTIHFMVPQTSVIRFFVDTAQSGVLVKFRVLDADNQEILSSSTYENTDDSYLGAATEIAIVHQPEGREPEKAPYTISLEYKHTGLAKQRHELDNFCPIVDIRLIVEPFNTAASAIKCKEHQSLVPYATDMEPMQFSGMTRAVTKKVTINSQDQTLFEHDEGNTNNFALLKYQIAIRNSGNALTILATYPFSELQMFMYLIDDRTGGVVAVQRTSSLEGDRHSSNILSMKSDMASFIEEPRIEQGVYTLEIAIPKAVFLPTKEHPSCLTFDLVVEYVSRTHGQNAEHDGLYDIIAIRPISLLSMWKDDARIIDVDFDREFEFDDIVSSLADRRYICSLHNKNNPAGIIHPVTASKEEGSTLRLHFDFKNEQHFEAGSCFNLKCSTLKSKNAEMIRQQQVAEYCFESSDDHNKEATTVCNPHAMPQIADDGSCVCADPYTGRDCRACIEGFKPYQEVSGGNVECIIDVDHMSKAVCNSHGRPESSGYSHIDQVKCECDKGYGGQYCDFCTNPEYAFPDCSTETSSIIYNTEIQHAFLSRQKYDEHGYSTVAQRYFPEGELEPSIFNEECGWVDYPDSFDRTELMREFSSGDFHISDVYVVNHKQDNVIKFKPRQKGHLKILLQQPESPVVSSGPAEAAFDLEIGIYDPLKKSFVQSSMNSHLKLNSGTSAKLEHASLSFKVLDEHLERNMYIFFRALNFTDDGSGHKANEGCLTLYMEAEFRQTDTICRNDPNHKPSSDIHTLRMTDDGVKTTHSIDDASQTFFTYQDFYLPEDRALGDAPYEVTISLQQKFHESNTLDIIVEVLQQDVQLENIHKDQHRPDVQAQYSQQQETGTMQEEEQGRAEQIKGKMSPVCKGTCMIGGEKAYNEMMRVIDLDAMTYFRVWLMQAKPQSIGHDSSRTDPCANYQLFVKANPSNREVSVDRKLGQQLRCPSEELPISLNVPRYLSGPNGQQKDFHYSQAYRVDHLWHNQAHKIEFKLTEQTLVRIVAPVHKHLDFDIVLNQDTGSYTHETLMRAKLEDHHIQIFALLDKGAYHFKFEFFSDASLLQLPCQTIHLEMAMMLSKDAKEQISNLRQIERKYEPVHDLSLVDLFKSSTNRAIVMHRQDYITIEHINSEAAQKGDAFELFVELFKESFEVAQDDNIGVFIEVKSDFLLSAAHVVLQNTVSGTIFEQESHEGTTALTVELLPPGKYVALVYTHKCLTNIVEESQRDIKAFDVLIDVRLRPLRKIHNGQLAQAMVPIKLSDQSSNKEDEQVTPLLATDDELHCKSEYLPLPDELDPNGLTNQIDFSEQFFLPTFSYTSHHIEYTARKDQNGMRIVLAKSNCKVSLLNDESRQVVSESRPIDDGQAQLLIASDLQEGQKYVIILEFSEKHGSLEVNTLRSCHHFILSIKTVTKDQMQLESFQGISPTSLQSGVDGTFREATIQMKKKTERMTITIPSQQNQNIDLQFILDYSSSFYPADLVLTAAQKGQPTISEGDLSEEEKEEVQLITSETSPTLVGFGRKQATNYLFVNIVPGTYEITLHQRFKPKDTISPITLSYRAWPAGASSVSLERGGMSGLQIYQSESEENEQPRAANRLPLDLNSYKFMAAPTGSPHLMENVLFSGPIQLDEQEQKNHITFQIESTSLIRVYAERAGIIFQLEQLDGDHSKPMPGMMGSALIKKINKGHYRIKVREGTAQGRKNSRLMAPRAHMTIVLAEQHVEELYNKTWSSIIEGCDSGASFPLALRQQKQQDVHQLFYDYPLIKVDPQLMRSRQVLQTYNFRVNVTSRLYFEVGMHMHSYHVTMQLNSLNERAYTVQGKQRGNLNILDIQVSPGDYSVTIKQPSIGTSFFDHTCGLFSLQGLVEPIGMMTESARSGEITQKGIWETCSELAVASDVLPMKIHGSEGTTRGGGELHIDATGHFNKKFRNVLFKLGQDSSSSPESDRITIEVLEDSWLHLSFEYLEQGFNQIKATLVDTLMLGQQVTAQSSFGINNIEGDLVEQVYSFKMVKGHHYQLNVQYIGWAVRDEEGNPTCNYYDLSMSISRNTNILLASQCPVKDDIPTVHDGLPKQIQDSDLNHEGIYNFSKMLRVSDFGSAGGSVRLPVIAHAVSIDLTKNYDMTAQIEFEFDQAMYSMQLNEIKNGDSDQPVVQSHVRLQQPLFFKQNDDHQRTAVRELIGDGIEAGNHDDKKRNILFFYNHEPGFIPAINKDAPKGGHGSCLFLNFKIFIKSTEQQTEQLYSKSQGANKGVAPQISSCWPADSPTFLHEKPETLNFDIVFNKEPFIKGQDTSEKSANLMHLREAIKLKATIVSLVDGLKSQIQIQATSIYSNNKEYRDDEYHVGVVFDVAEFARSGTDKILHAQLFINHEKLMDEDQSEFTFEKHLEMRGLPIFVFEEPDTAQIVKEETDDIQQAVSDEKVGIEAQTELGADVATTTSDLEKQIQETRTQEQQEAAKENVPCNCVHGTCQVGQSTCSHCDSGWTGPHCDTPTTDETTQNVNQNQKKDYTEDGLYQPQQTSDERKTGPAKDIQTGSQMRQEAKPIEEHHERQEKHHGEPQPSRPKKIDDDDVWGDRAHERTQEHHTPPHQEATQTTEIKSGPQTDNVTEQDSNKKYQTGALIASVLVFLYCLCGKSGQQSPNVPKRRYGALGAKDPESDSDGDSADDPRERRKMLELHSFGDERKSGAYRRGKKDPSSGTAASDSSSRQQRGSFPMASFSQTSQKSNDSAKSSNQGVAQPFSSSDPADADETGEQLQRELELFAQDEDQEEQALMDDNTGGQDDGGFGSYADPQSWSGGQAQQQYQQNDAPGTDDLDELERYFDQKDYQ